MRDFLSGVGVILSLELRQRVRGVAWYVLLGLFVGLIAIVTLLLTIALTGFGATDAGGGIFSTIIYFVLLLGTLVAPALSGNAINGDRDAGTLATTQVTLVTTWQLVFGKFLAAWISSLAFLAVAIPFLVYSSIVGGLAAGTIAVSVLVLAVELGVVAAIGVGLSGILNRPLFSIVATYLAVATLSIGTLIAFGLGGLAIQSEVTSTRHYPITYPQGEIPTDCMETEIYEYNTPRYDYVWGLLVANPYIVLADAVPTEFVHGQPTDLFGFIKTGARSAQIPPETEVEYSECDLSFDEPPTAEEIVNSTTPSWLVGLALQLALATGVLAWAAARTRTPAGRLSEGSRVA